MGVIFFLTRGNYIPGIIKLAHDGTILWQKVVGINDGSGAVGNPTSDGDLIVAFMGFYDGSIGSNAHFLKLDKDGNVEWQSSFGSQYLDNPLDVIETDDGGFVFCR